MIQAIGEANLCETTAGPPFPGLRPFSYRDHKYFFGRDEQIFELYRLLTRHHFIAVVGSSGSGKSSIIRAGLLPVLDRESEERRHRVWHWTTMRPGLNPINRLAGALATAVQPAGDRFLSARRDRIASILRSSRAGIMESLSDVGVEQGAELVILVDQFEELFRFLTPAQAVADRAEVAKRREESTHFVQLLLDATRSHDSPVRVVLTMRSDFIGDCARFQGLPEAVSAAQFLVPSLTRDQREEAIRKPLELSNTSIEPTLVERLLNDSSDELDQLPLLQHCLARLWTCASRSMHPEPAEPPTSGPPRGPHITEQTYRDVGGTMGAISGHANEIFASLQGAETTIERIFQALAEIDKDGRIIRRARSLNQLLAEAGQPAAEMYAVLDKFRADECSFVVPPLSSLETTEQLPTDTIIDIGHEALLRCWERVCGEPGATGERSDKRDVGWLRREQKDGNHYLFLRSCLDPDSPNESGLSTDQTRRSWTWWQRRKPSEAWAARYGGAFAEVENLVRRSFLASRRSGLKRRAAYAAVALVLPAIIILSAITIQNAHETASIFRVTAKSAKLISHNILEQFNNGRLGLVGAEILHQSADDLYQSVQHIKETTETAALRTEWLLAEADIADAFNKPDQVRNYVEQALKNAKRLAALDPNNRDWQELLYESLFRNGDLELTKFLNLGKNESLADRAAESAMDHYLRSHSAAEKIASLDIPPPGHFEVADVMRSEDDTFRLVFSTNKIGEALLAKGDFSGALAKFQEALEKAADLESSAKMDRRLQSAFTRFKIASVLISAQPPNYSAAILRYNEAIGIEERALSAAPKNHIVRSNLAAALAARAHASSKMASPGRAAVDAAEADFTQAEELRRSLADENPDNPQWLERLAQLRKLYGEHLAQAAHVDGSLVDQAIGQVGREMEVLDRLREIEPAASDWRNNLTSCRKRLNDLQALAAASGSTNRH